ncbi:MAG: cell division protein ZapA [Bacteroidales bacterium]|nr:cell division protein ZapA [Bacteroidales bacterium]
MEHIKISVNIADRPYRLKINKKEEEVVRMATKSIDERIKEYSENFAYQDKQDLLAMVALHFATNSQKLEIKEVYKDNELEKKLNEIDTILSENL